MHALAVRAVAPASLSTAPAKVHHVVAAVKRIMLPARRAWAVARSAIEEAPAVITEPPSVFAAKHWWDVDRVPIVDKETAIVRIAAGIDVISSAKHKLHRFPGNI